MKNETNKKNLNKLTRLLALMDEDALTRKEFVSHFKRVIDVVKGLKVKNEDWVNSLKKNIDELRDKLSKDNSEETSKKLTDAESRLLSSINKALKEQEQGMNFIRDNLRRLKNGKDGLPGRDGRNADPQDVVDLIKKDFSQLNEPIRDALELLKDDERLDVSAIRDIVGIHVGDTPPIDKTKLWVDTSSY
jgi:hypothetical protein